MKKSSVKKKLHKKHRRNWGGIGSLYVIAVLALMSIFGYMLIGDALPSQTPINPDNAQVAIQTPVPTPGQNNLQLYTFNGATLTPAPTSPPAAPPAACTFTAENTEPQILIGSDPPPNTPATATGTIRIWVTDEGVPYISPQEVVDPQTGDITTPGVRTALDTGTDGGGQYSWEPTIYIYPAGTTNFNCNAVNNSCTPHYPDEIKGDYNSNPPNGIRGVAAEQGPPIDQDYVNFENGPAFNGGGNPLFGPGGLQEFTSEYIWHVQNFGLSPGNYDAQYIIHDGDINIGVDCLTLTI